MSSSQFPLGYLGVIHGQCSALFKNMVGKYKCPDGTWLTKQKIKLIGDVVRIAPNEVVFITPEAYTGIDS